MRARSHPIRFYQVGSFPSTSENVVVWCFRTKIISTLSDFTFQRLKTKNLLQMRMERIEISLDRGQHSSVCVFFWVKTMKWRMLTRWDVSRKVKTNWDLCFFVSVSLHLHSCKTLQLEIEEIRIHIWSWWYLKLKKRRKVTLMNLTIWLHYRLQWILQQRTLFGVLFNSHQLNEQMMHHNVRWEVKESNSKSNGEKHIGWFDDENEDA